MAKLRLSSIFALFALLFALQAGTAQQQPAGPRPAALAWQPWSSDLFIQAQRENKFVLLDLEAVWCHWCHVMDDVTYRDPKVIGLLKSKYILVKVDQDSRPDLSNRYEDYGWPATVVFNAKEGEIVRRQGYMPPKEMASMLQAIIDDPSPGPSVTPDAPVAISSTSAFSAGLLSKLHKQFNQQYDTAHAGWGFGHKYLDLDSTEYAMLLGQHGDRMAGERARDTLRAERRILDPVWGGAYQYSAGPGWDEPHFEKLISIQADTLQAYSLAYAQWRDPADLRAAQGIHGYVRNFLTAPTGAFYVSQDADLIAGKHSAGYFALSDAGRRRAGVPKVDTHLYARENGWMIAALCQLYASTGDPTALEEARRAALWTMANRALAGGGFRHDAHDAAGPYLGDSLAMGEAFLSLYTVTGERRWLDAAESARRFIGLRFAPAAGAGGYITSATATDRAYRPHPERDENAQLIRFSNLLYQYTGNAADRATADGAMHYLATREIALRPLSASVLLADYEFKTAPIHVTIVAKKDDATARSLYHAALRVPTSFKRIEWWDPSAGAPARNDVQYPQLGRAAAFLCTARACSSPIFSAEQLDAKVRRILPAVQVAVASTNH